MRRLLATLVLALLADTVLASPQSAVAGAVRDARQLPADVACDTLYLDASNIPAEDLGEFYAVVCGWVHHLSREADIVKPRRVQADLFAVRRSDYGWLAQTQERLRAEPYFHEHWRELKGDGYYYRYHKAGSWLDPKLIRELEERTHSQAPVVRADFWLFYSSRQLDLRNKNVSGFAYLDWLQLKSRKDAEELAGLDRRKAIKLGKELRAVIEQGRSGIAQLDRQISWAATYGDGRFGFWQTLDTFDNGDGNTAASKLKDGQFKHNAEEIMFGLPNNHVGQFLNNDKGVKQDFAPPEIGGMDAPLRVGRDPRIHVGQCHWCHTNGMLKDVDDWARRTLRLPLSLDDTSYQELQRLKRQYLRSLEAQIEQGRQQYEAALAESCGLASGEFARLHSKYHYRYLYQPRDAATLALEMGVTEEALLRSLRRAFDKRNEHGLPPEEKLRLADLFSLIAKEPSPVPVTIVESLFADLQRIVCEYSR